MQVTDQRPPTAEQWAEAPARALEENRATPRSVSSSFSVAIDAGIRASAGSVLTRRPKERA